ncbi:hypothetical protein [Enterococcus mundtii]|uniref:hypothetical protein n=1 Tax=Enterococcus mundtii TaxID=53346 RepID=UPI0035C6A218
MRAHYQRFYSNKAGHSQRTSATEQPKRVEGAGAAYFPLLMSEQPQSSMRHQDQAPRNDQAGETILEEEEEYLCSAIIRISKKIQ